MVLCSLIWKTLISCCLSVEDDSNYCCSVPQPIVHVFSHFCCLNLVFCCSPQQGLLRTIFPEFWHIDNSFSGSLNLSVLLEILWLSLYFLEHLKFKLWLCKHTIWSLKGCILFTIEHHKLGIWDWSFNFRRKTLRLYHGIYISGLSKPVR